MEIKPKEIQSCMEHLLDEKSLNVPSELSFVSMSEAINPEHMGTQQLMDIEHEMQRLGFNMPEIKRVQSYIRRNEDFLMLAHRLRTAPDSKQAKADLGERSRVFTKAQAPVRMNFKKEPTAAAEDREETVGERAKRGDEAGVGEGADASVAPRPEERAEGRVESEGGRDGEKSVEAEGEGGENEDAEGEEGEVIEMVETVAMGADRGAEESMMGNESFEYLYSVLQSMSQKKEIISASMVYSELYKKKMEEIKEESTRDKPDAGDSESKPKPAKSEDKPRAEEAQTTPLATRSRMEEQVERIHNFLFGQTSGLVDHIATGQGEHRAG